MNKIKKLRKHLIIQPGETYTFENRDYKVITATSKILGASGNTISFSEEVFWLQDIETNEMRYVKSSILKKELPRYNEVVMI